MVLHKKYHPCKIDTTSVVYDILSHIATYRYQQTCLQLKISINATQWQHALSLSLFVIHSEIIQSRERDKEGERKRGGLKLYGSNSLLCCVVEEWFLHDPDELKEWMVTWHVLSIKGPVRSAIKVVIIPQVISVWSTGENDNSVARKI